MDQLPCLKKIRGGQRAYLSKLMSKWTKLKTMRFDEKILDLLATDSEQEEDAFAKEIEESETLAEKENFALTSIDKILKEILMSNQSK